MEITFKAKLCISALTTTLALLSTPAAGSTDPASYPSKPIRMVVPQPPGGITDLLGRITAEELGKKYGQPLVVENRVGASGHIGAQQVAKGEPDGYTMLLGTIGIHAAYKVYSKLSYDPAKDLQPVTVLGASPNIVVVPANSRFKSFEEVLAYEKAHPGQLNYGTAGPGSSVHMVTALYEQFCGSKLSYVPYKGSGPALIDLIAGRVDVMFDNLPSGYPHVKSGKLRILAITSKDRHPLIPDVPTIAESGLPGYDAGSWFTVAMARDVPKPLIDKVNADLRSVMSTPQIRAKLLDLGITLVANTPEEASSMFVSETKKWTKVIEASNIKLD
ncbi:MAG: tripartite tricarboxylate transporter substrate binding protein [Burkholderiaceae bacterium]